MMDAVEFVRNYKKMLKKRCFGLLIDSDENTPEEIVAETENWAKEHPAKTHQSEFLKQWPEAGLMQDGVITICPLMISAAYRDGNGACNKSSSDRCADCKREFWSAEVEE